VPPPYPREQRAARAVLARLLGRRDFVRIIHYSCESLADKPDGTSPRVTSIAVRHLHSGDTRSFSIHSVAEEQDVGLLDIEARYDDVERIMLDQFFAYARDSGAVEFLHWNMRDANYGFAAIAHRYAVLGGEIAHEIPEDHRHDLSILLKDIYGTDYIPHPRLENLARENDITLMQFLPGAAEAEAFVRKDYVALHQSTLRKVAVLEAVAERAHHNTLKTRSSWWDMHGGNVRSAWSWLVTNQTIVFLLAVIGIIIGVFAWFHPRPTPQ
jgi:hypothetical protein